MSNHFSKTDLTPKEVEQVLILRNKLKDTSSLSYARSLKQRIDNILARGARRYLEAQSEHNSLIVKP